MMDLISAERRELAGVLESLSAEQWRSPSLCAGWTTAHVVAHLTMPFRITEEEFGRGMAEAHGQVTEFSDAVGARGGRAAGQHRQPVGPAGWRAAGRAEPRPDPRPRHRVAAVDHLSDPRQGHDHGARPDL